MKRLLSIIVVMAILAPLMLFAGGSTEVTETETTSAGTAKTGGLPPGQYNLDDYEAQTGTKLTFSDSPFLDGKGLPPVEERLPDNPLVMETWMENGVFGGTLTWTEYTIDHGHYLRHLNAVKLLEIAPSASNHRYNFVGAEVQPSVLEKWDQNADATEFTFMIRKGLKWSDGVPVTTEDVTYTFEDCYFNEEITPNLPSWLRWGGEPAELTVIDDYTFSIKFAKPYGLFISEITGSNAGRFMRPKHYMTQFHKKYTDISKILPVMEDQGYSEEEWGKFYNSFDAGASDAANHIPTRYPNAIDCPSLHPWHVVDEPNPGEFILERNPYYFKVDPTGKQLPYIDKGHRIFVTDLEVMNAKIVAGETDLQFQFIRLGDFPLFKSNEEKGGYKTMALPAWQDQLLIYFASLTPEDPVYAEVVQDKRFRQALSLAIDREEVKKSVFLDFGRVAQYAPPKGSDVWEQYMDDAYVEYDPDKANQLLDEMGLKWDDKKEYRLLPDGRRLTIPFTYYEVTPTATPGAELFPEFMTPIGVDCQIKQVDGRLYWSQNQAGEIHFADWWLPVQYMHIYGPAFFSVTAFGWNTWINTQGESGVEPPEDVKRLYELKEIMQSTGDPAERLRAHKEIWESQAENVWVIGTVAAAPVPFVYNKNLGNIEIAEEWGFYSVVVGDFAEQWYWKQ
ncbi:MAG: hypothetical protein CMN78_03080 [Spirochaetales bacterium]|nr:hypothetical protein [Spirochaetales bacterium]